MKFSLRKLLFFFSVLLSLSANAQIVFELCPVTSKPIDSSWTATLTIRNNTGVVIDFSNTMTLKWPSLRGDLPWPFSNTSYSGDNVTFTLNGVFDWQNKLPVGASWSHNAEIRGGYYESKAFNLPTWGTLTQDGVTHEVEVKHCNQTSTYELYDTQIEFDRGCFIYSPTSGLCLGEGASEVWKGEGVYDIMMPSDRPSWAIGTMVAHRLFSNLVGDEEMLSPNFWTATSLNESRMSCDNTIVPNQKNHCYINSDVNTCQTNGVGTAGGKTVNNCYQILNIGYAQIANNQPDLFAQSNAYGTASYSTVVGSDQYEAAAIAVAYYHYQDIRYWNQIFCWNAIQFNMDAQDPYAVEKVFYHAYHDGPNAGIQLLNAIDANYAGAVSATNMNDAIGGTGTWASTTSGSQKVANFTSLLDDNGIIYPTDKSDNTTEYYGCYTSDIAWSDVVYYINKVKILYPHLMDSDIQTQIQSVFNGINGGSDVPFSNLGPVIDEIVIQMGGHDPSKYLAEQYSASKTCGENPVGISLRSDDVLCPGEQGTLQVWLAGDPNFRVDILYPDGTIHTFDNISNSPYNVSIDQPGYYEVVYFEDADEVGNLNCNFSSLTVESQNDAVVSWNRDGYNATDDCYEGDLIMEKRGGAVTVSYTKGGVTQTDITFGEFDFDKNITSSTAGSEYIITNISPNACGSSFNDAIEFCGVVTGCNKPSSVTISNASPVVGCQGDDITLSGSFVDGGNPIANGMAYVWYKQGSTPGAYSNTTGTIGNNTLSSLAVADAGTYVLRVQDGTTPTDAACYTEQTVELTVTATPSALTVTTPQEFCQGTTGAALTVPAAGTGNSISWNTIATGAGTPSSTAPTINTGTAGSPVVTHYVSRITSAATGSCESPRAAIAVNINPAPSITNTTLSEEICSSETSSGFTITSDIASTTYGWTSASIGVTGATASGTSDVPAEALTGSGTVTYSVTPRGSTPTSCEGLPQDFVVTINSLPTGSIAIDKTLICDNSVDEATITLTGSGGTGPYIIDYERGGVPIQVTGVAPSEEVKTKLAESLELIGVTDSKGCKATDLGTIQTVTTTHVEEPELLTKRFECNPSNPTGGLPGTYEYRMIVEATKGDVASYAISGTFGGSVTSGSQVGAIWTSDWVVENTGDAFAVNLTDVNGCQPLLITGDTVCSCPESATISVVTGSPGKVCVQGDMTTTNLEVTFTSNGTGATSYDFDIRKDGNVVQSETGHDGSVYSYPSQGFGEYTITGLVGTCSGAANTLKVDTLESPTGSIAAIDDTLCIGEDNAEIQLSGDLGQSPWDFIVNTVVTSVSSTGTLAPSTGGVYTVSEIKDGNGCTAKDVTGLSVTIGEVAPPTGSITAPESVATGSTGTHIYNPSTLSLSASGLASGYVGLWNISSVSGTGTPVLSSPLNSVTNEVSGMHMDDVATVTWEVSDQGSECPSATATLTVERKDVTIAQVSGTELCSDFTGYTLVGNGLVPGETATWSLSALSPTTGLTVAAVGGTSGKEAMVSGFTMPANTSSVDVIFEYAVTPIVGAVTKDTMLVRVYASPVSNPGTDEMMCGAAYQLKAPVLTIGTGEWTSNQSAVTFDDLTRNDATASNLPAGSPGSPVDIEFIWEVSNGVCAPVSNSVTITRSGDLTTPSPSVVGGVSELCITNLTGISLTGSAPSSSNSETSLWSVSPTTGVTLTSSVGDPNANASFSALGVYEFTYQIDNPTCPSSEGKVTVEVKDTASLTNANITLGCEGEEVVATASGLSSSTEVITWKSGTGATLSGAADQLNTTFILAADGSEVSTVKVIPSNAICGVGTAVTATNTIKLKPQDEPVIQPTSGVLPAVVCATKSDKYEAKSTDADSYTWTWNTGTNVEKLNKVATTTELELEEADFGSAEVGTITVFTHNTCGEGVSGTLEVGIIQAKPIDVKLVSDKTDDKFCIEEDVVTFTASSTAGTLNGLVPDYRFLIGGTEKQAQSTKDSCIANLGDLSDGSVVTVEIEGDPSGCYTTNTNSTSLTMDGYNVPDVSLEASALKICEEDGNIELTITGMSKGDFVTSWSRDSEILKNKTTSYTAKSPEEEGFYEVEVGNEVCTQISIPNKGITIYKQPEIVNFESAEGDANKQTIELGGRYIYSIQEEGSLASGIIPVNIEGLETGGSVYYSWDALTIDIENNQPKMYFSKEGETEGVEWVSLVVTVGEGPEACVDTAGFFMGVTLPLEVPNAFSPNGDGVNDKWEIQGLNDYENAHMTIFNRWGAKIFEDYSYRQGDAWDGESYPVGTYYYILKLKKEEKVSGEDNVIRGAVTITK